MTEGAQTTPRVGHHVVVGCGLVGGAVVRELRRLGAPVVVIERSPEKLKRVRDLLDDSCAALIGDAFDEEVFAQADVAGAIGLATALSAERDNLFLALQARQVNPHLRVVSRVSNVSIRNKFRTVGVETVVSAARLGGVRLAHELLHPELATFSEALLATDDRTDLLMAIEVQQGSEFAGRLLGEIDVQARTGCMVLGISRRRNGTYAYHPDMRTRIRAGGMIVALGGSDELDKLQALLSGPATPEQPDNGSPEPPAAEEE